MTLHRCISLVHRQTGLPSIVLCIIVLPDVPTVTVCVKYREAESQSDPLVRTSNLRVLFLLKKKIIIIIIVSEEKKKKQNKENSWLTYIDIDASHFPVMMIAKIQQVAATKNMPMHVLSAFQFSYLY